MANDKKRFPYVALAELIAVLAAVLFWFGFW
jgi:hypothetical protein